MDYGPTRNVFMREEGLNVTYAIAKQPQKVAFKTMCFWSIKLNSKALYYMTGIKRGCCTVFLFTKKYNFSYSIQVTLFDPRLRSKHSKYEVGINHIHKNWHFFITNVVIPSSCEGAWQISSRPIPRLFFETKCFRDRYRDFFETKFFRDWYRDFCKS